MITLGALTAWEHRLLQELFGHAGTLEERDTAWTRGGLYAEYAALFGGYVELAELADEPAVRAEALRRAVFLAWYEGVEPAPLTGLVELPEGAVRRTLELLERRCAGGERDPELDWMLPWYALVAEHALLRLPGLHCLESWIRCGDARAWEHAVREPGSVDDRGAMGRYWRSLRP